MRRTAEEKKIDKMFKRKFAFLETSCDYCGDLFRFESYLAAFCLGNCCCKCAPSKKDAHKLRFDFPPSVRSVIERNHMRRAIKRQKQIDTARAGLLEIITIITENENESMNSEVTELQMKIVTAAENTLRGMEENEN